MASVRSAAVGTLYKDYFTILAGVSEPLQALVAAHVTCVIQKKHSRCVCLCAIVLLQGRRQSWLQCYNHDCMLFARAASLMVGLVFLNMVEKNNSIGYNVPVRLGNW